MCPRCHTGLLVYDGPIESDTGPSYHCVNCGCYIDHVITANKRAQHEGKLEHTKTQKSARTWVGDYSHPLSIRVSHVLWSDSLLGI